jgi:Uma2 family endonuclease
VAAMGRRRLETRSGRLMGPFQFGKGGPEAPGGWVIIFEPRVCLGDEIRVPDLAAWHADRFVEIPDAGPIPIVPDWIAEVLSPSTEVEDRTVKRDLYAKTGVRHLWLLHPSLHTLEIHRLAADLTWTLVATVAGRVRVRAEPFDAVELDLALIWPPGDPPVAD